MTLDAKVVAWQNDLIDMSRMNRLLYFSSDTARGRASSVRFLIEPATLFTQMYTSRRAFLVKPELTAEPEECELRLTRLRSRAREALNDRGTHVLYLAFGILEWRESESSQEVLRSPLLLVPITLTRKGIVGAFELHRQHAEDIELNPTLREKLRHDFQVSLPTFGEILDDWEQREQGTGNVPLSHIFEAVMRAIPPSSFTETWRIAREVHLSTFSYQKLVMYQDLQRHQAELLQHPILRALAGDRRHLSQPTTLPRAEELDTQVRPHDVLEILDADSSQQEAIAAAKAGASFVLQGPPGTGKSQTIANIIAESAGQGKRVLFVSEKLAALEVVRQRLRDAGLDDYCLDLHSQKTDKKAFIATLKQALVEADVQSTDAARQEFTWRHEADSLLDTRSKLNAYVRELHALRPPLQSSAYDAYARLAQLASVPDMAVQLHDGMRADRGELDTMRQALAHLLTWSDVLDEIETYPWRQTTLDEFSLTLAGSIRHHYERLAQTLDELEVLGDQLQSTLDEKGVAKTFGWLRDALARAAHLTRTPLPPRSWLADTDEVVRRVRFHTAPALQRSARSQVARAELLRAYRPTMLDLEHTDLLDALSSGVDTIMKAVRPNGKSPQDRCIEEREQIASHVRAANDILVALEQAAGQMANGCGFSPSERLADIPALVSVAELLLDTPGVPASWLDASTFVEVRATFLDARERYTQCKQSRASLDEHYLPDLYVLDLPTLSQRFAAEYGSVFRYLQPGYYADIRQVRSLLRHAPAAEGRSYEQVRMDLLKGARVIQEEQRLRDQRVEHSRLLGRAFAGAETDWPRLNEQVAWAERFHAVYVGGASDDVRALAMGTAPARLAPLRAARERLVRLWDEWQPQSAYWSALLRPDAIDPNAAQLDDLSPSTLKLALTAMEQPLGSFWNAIDAAGEQRLDDSSTLTWSSVCTALRLAQEVRTLEAWLETENTTLADDLGHFAAGLATNWEAIASALDWVDTIRALYGERPIPDAVRALATQETDDAQARTTRERLRSVIDAIGAHLQTVEEELRFSDTVLARAALLGSAASLDGARILDLRDRARFHIEQLPCLERWIACARHRSLCDGLGLGELLAAALHERPFPQDIVERFEKRFYQLWLDSVLRQSPPLQAFRGAAHEQIVRRFRQLDADHVALARRRLRGRLAEQRHAHIVAARAEPMGELAAALGTLRHEVSKKRNRAIRQIVQSTASALLALKPCWMMSPFSVSQFLESGERLFDLVIFDEASQVSPEDAICAILRGNQLIIVGDSKQLPPTRFFSRTLADLDSDDDEDVESDEVLNQAGALAVPAGDARRESILEECEAADLPRYALRWHYRSRHESLIAFSNAQFYGSSLLTFPGPEASHSAGVWFDYVKDGLYDRSRTRQNMREARRVVDLIIAHVQRWGSERSLGVVALSQAQQRAIEDVLEQRLKAEPDLRSAYGDLLDGDDSAGFFVKNLESVQGDERDVIVLSIGYGKDGAGKLSSNFGPVNKRGGERRLNVAVTRARLQLVVVSSMRADDLPRQLASPGAQALRDYLDYAERGPAALTSHSLTGARLPSATDAHTPTFDSPFEKAVYDALTARGLMLHTQVGCSGYRIDLAVRDPRRLDRYLLGIECDGATYHSSATARDRDRLRQRQLESLGWTIHRIWSRDWVLDTTGSIQRVIEAVETAQAHTIDTPADELSLAAVTPTASNASHATVSDATDADKSDDEADESVPVPVEPNSAHDKGTDTLPAPRRSLALRTPDVLPSLPLAVPLPDTAGEQEGITDVTQVTVSSADTPTIPIRRTAPPQSRPTDQVPRVRTCETCVSFSARSAKTFYCAHDATYKKRDRRGATLGCPAWERA